MAPQPPAWRRIQRAALLAVGLLFFLVSWPAPLRADTTASAEAFHCDGDPLSALLFPGPMDEPGITDPTTGPVPVGASWCCTGAT